MEDKKLRGWADVELNANMPITVLIDFLNTLNQRLVEIENNLKVHIEETNEDISLSELYIRQAEAAQKNKDKDKDNK